MSYVMTKTEIMGRPAVTNTETGKRIVVGDVVTVGNSKLEWDVINIFHDDIELHRQSSKVTYRRFPMDKLNVVISADDADRAYEEERDHTFKASELIEEMRRHGFELQVTQTGGGTATLELQAEGHDLFLIGPGSYDWANPEDSVFTTDELSYGLDMWEDDGETLRAEPPQEHMIPPITRLKEAAGIIATAYRQHTGLTGPEESPHWKAADRAAAALGHYNDNVLRNPSSVGDEGSDEFKEAMRDLLTDLRHLAFRSGIDFEEQNDVAGRRYYEEVQEFETWNW